MPDSEQQHDHDGERSENTRSSGTSPSPESGRDRPDGDDIRLPEERPDGVEEDTASGGAPEPA